MNQTYGRGQWRICNRCGAPEFDHRHGCSLNEETILRDAPVSTLVELRSLIEKPEYLCGVPRN